MLFADDMVLIAEDVQEVERMLEQVRMALEDKGLRVNREVKLSRGRPEQTWNGVVKRDMKKRGLVEERAQDRVE